METIEKERTIEMEVVILCYNLHDYKSKIELKDLVYIGGEYYNVVKIDPNYGMEDKQINPAMYFVESKINGELMNFERSEISKSMLGYFDANEYFKNDKKKFICTVPISNPAFKKDISYIKAKFACGWDMGTSDFDSIQTCHLNELTVNGLVIEHTRDVIQCRAELPNFKTFKVDVK